MTSLVRAVVVAALALSLVATAGCGGDTKKSNDYVVAINKVQTDFVNSVTKQAAGPAAGSTQQAKDIFNNLDAALGKLVTQLNGITPPDKVKTLHRELVSEIQQFQTAVRHAGAAASSGDPQKMLAARTSFGSEISKVGLKFNNTISAINTQLHK